MIFQVNIIESVVCGISAFHAECPDCGWRCHRKPHDGDKQAVKCAEKHNH